MSLPLPPIALCPEKFMVGMANLDDAVPTVPTVPFEDVFTQDSRTDAHFLTYLIHPLQPFPRLRKVALPKLRAAGAEVFSTMLVHDWDTPGHVPWTPELFGAFAAQWSGIVAEWPLAGQWSCMYTSRNGARIVYVLDEPVPVDIGEAHHTWMVQEFRRRGFLVDEGCSDWTRVFRAPYVLRDGKPTRADPFALLQLETARRLPVASLGKLEFKPSSFVGEIKEIDDPMPDPDQARALLEAPNRSNGRMVSSEWYKAAKSALTGRECYQCLFEMRPMATKGHRDETLQQFIGQVVARTFEIAGTSPQHVYALFLPVVEQLQPDESTPSWTQSCWSKVKRIWATHAAKHQGAEIARAQQEIEAVSTIEGMARGAGRWAGADFQALPIEQKVDWVRSHLLVACGDCIFAMQRDGSYSPMPLSNRTVVPYLRSLKLEGVVDLQEPKENGRGFRDVSAQDLLNKHGTVVKDAILSPGLEYSMVKRPDTPEAVLALTGFRLNPHLQPVYDAEVDQWLHQLFGEEYYERGCRWIGHALDITGGTICALSLQGEPGCGKNMFVQGLAENLVTPSIADGKDLVSEYQYGMADSPFIWIDEGWPRGGKSTAHPADIFRAVTGGTPMRLNRRYMHPVQVNFGYRVIFTANNLSLIEALGHGRDLSPADRQGLACRLFHVNIPKAATPWLERKGGLKYTGSPGRRWIASGGGKDDSDYILAQHFRWLHSQRGPADTVRFAMDGIPDAEIMRKLSTGTGKAPLVVETLVKLAEDPQMRDGFAMVGDSIYVTSSTVLDYFRTRIAPTSRETLTLGQVESVLKGLVVEQTPPPYVLSAKPSLGPCVWHRIAPETLRREAQESGMPTKNLTKMMSGDMARNQAIFENTPNTERWQGRVN